MTEQPEFSLELIAGPDGFGSGEHPTTHIAMQAMYALASLRDFAQVLDLGCGAGLLAMTAAHLWPEARVLATDIEASAVKMAEQNVAHNGVSERIDVLRSNGYRHAHLQARAPYDLIICNITADSIIRMASDLQKALADDGVVILSGILRWRSDEILRLHEHLGLVPALATLGMDDWECHVLVKSAA